MRKMLTPYLAYARASSITSSNAQGLFVLSLGGVGFQLVMLMAVWKVLLSGGAMNGLDWSHMRAYLLITFVSGALVGTFVDFSMADRIKSGMVALDLVKPVNYQRARFFETLGGLRIEFAVVAVLVAATVLFGGLPALPAHPQMTLFTVSILVMVPLKFSIIYLSTLACFWTENFVGVLWIRQAMTSLLSGALVPLAYFPGWLATAAQWSPFAGLTSTPALLFAGQVSGWRAVLMVVAQITWLVVLWCGASPLFRRALRRVTIQGG